MSDHPEMEDAVIKQVPTIIENPIVVLKSLTRDDSIVLFGELKAANNKPVMASIELTPKAAGKMEAEISLVTSAHSRTEGNIANLLKKSEVLYLDTNKKEPILG